VKELINSDLEPGTHRITWNGENEKGETVSSGIYLYKLQSGEETYIRKMTIFK